MTKTAKERLAWVGSDIMPVPDAVSKPFVGFKHLANPDYLLYLMQKREGVLLLELNGCMNRDARAGVPMFETWYRRQSDAVQGLAKAYIERVCMEHFLGEVKRVDARVGVVLELVATLFALDCIERDVATFVVHDLLGGHEVKQVQEEARRLCGRGEGGLADLALPLVEAFGVPEWLLPPAARDWVKYNAKDNQGELLGMDY